MPGYDYGNPRVRAMKSRLLSREELEALARLEDPPSLIAALSKTPYEPAVEAALTITSGAACVQEAHRQDLLETLRKLKEFYTGPAQDNLRLWVRRYDLHNLKAILRGLSQNFLADEILPALLPVGEIPESILKRLVRAESTREVINLLVSLGLPFAQPLLELQGKSPNAPVSEMELVLEKWYFQQAGKALRRPPQDAAVLKASLELEADLLNLITALRYVSHPVEREYLPHPIRELFVGPGSLPPEKLETFSAQDSYPDAVNLLRETPYSKALQTGLEAYQRSGLVSEFEVQLRRYRLSWLSGQIQRDALGIGVPLGYLALKINEISNLLWISRGAALKLDPKLIQENLEFAV